MEQGKAHHNSHLFTLRLWSEKVGEGKSEWRVKVQHVTSGETRYFRDWTRVVDHLLSMLPERTAPRQQNGASPEELSGPRPTTYQAIEEVEQ